MSWTPWLLSRTLPVIQGSNARDKGQVASWLVKWHFLKETPKEKLFHASIGTFWTPRLLSGTNFVLQGYNDLDDWRENFGRGGGVASVAAMPQIEKGRSLAEPNRLPAGPRKKRPLGRLFSSIVYGHITFSMYSNDHQNIFGISWKQAHVTVVVTPFWGEHGMHWLHWRPYLLCYCQWTPSKSNNLSF